MRVNRSMLTVPFILLALAAPFKESPAQGTSLGAIPQKNVNIIGPTPINWLYAGNPRMQQNEPDCAVSPGNPEWLFCGVNDYRGVNDPALGDSFQGIAMSRDGGKTWISGLHPGHLGDLPNINQKFAADPNAEALPNLLLYNFIAGWRDDSFPGGIYVSRWYEHNREVGPPWEYLDTYEVATGTSGKFLDKPAFRTALYDPNDGRPPITVNIPAFQDPRNLANNHPAYTLNVPAARTHLCYAVFVGNDNNNGTKIECQRSDDGGVTWTGQKLSESVEINQGVSLATRNNGQEVLAVWRRFSDNNETSAIMYAHSVDFGDTWSKAETLTEFCAFDQGTGPARFRTNALPVATSNGDDFAVYFTARNDATATCFEPTQGNKKNAPLVFSMSDAAAEFDFDSFEENRNPDGTRIRDGQIRSALNYARIFMVRENAGGNFSWSSPEMVDPQTVDGTDNPNAPRKPFHQFMPAVSAAGGIETVAWYDSRFDRLINRPNPLPSGFVEDLVLNYVPATLTETAKGSLLPAGFYEIEPPPVPLADLPDPANNVPLRRNIDVMAAQYTNGGFRDYFVDADFYPTAGGAPSPSVRVTRFATRQKPGGAPGEKEQLEFNYPNGRLFQKGKAPFIGDYNTVFVQSARQREDLTWVSSQKAPQPGDLFGSKEPVFHVGWTSNRNVRGRVFYTGCDVWDDALQMWVASPGCDSTYNDPVPPVNPAMMMPLQGEDGSNDGPPLACTDATGTARPLTRNQNVFVAAMKPGVNVEVVSAIKLPDGTGFNTFVLSLTNGTNNSKTVELRLPAFDVADPTPITFDRTDLALRQIRVDVPRGSGNARTVFDYANVLDTSYTPIVVVDVYDVTGLPEGQTGELIARVPLLRESLAPLENVQNNDPTDLRDIIDPGDGEFYDIILKREAGTTQSLDLENLDLENTVYMLDLENLDLENLDLENLDLENLDLENVVLFLDLENLDLENLDLENALYEQLDLENLDLENLDLENLDLENLDLENRNLLFLDLENLDLENDVLQFLDLENLDLENLDLENLDLENLDLENLDLENLDLENLDLENDTIYASDLENLDLENLDLENSAPGDTYTEITWTADSATNTTTGVDIKPLFSQNLADAIVATSSAEGDPDGTIPDTRVLLTVRKPYLTGTVQNNAFNGGSSFCTPQVVVENQLIFAALLTPDQLNNIIADPDPSDPKTPSFIVDPDGSTIITLRLINPPPGYSDIQTASRNTGIALYTQPGNTVTCDEGSNGISEVCEVDFVNDVTPPAITLLGDNPQVIEAGGVYVEAGATAIDDIDGDVTVDIAIDALAVNTNVPGSYGVVYTVTDLSGNVGSETRTVSVVDTTAPVITLTGANPQVIEAGDGYVELGATASDFVDGDGLTVTEINASAVNTAVPGSYTVTYNFSDAAGNAALQISRTVSVVDTTVPVITLTGANPQVIEAGDLYSEFGATASDIADGDLTASIVIDASAVNTGVPGSYTVTYNVSDAAGNPAAQVARTVSVVDTTDPVITLVGDSLVTVEAATPYADAGATATDSLDGDLTTAIVTVNPVDVTVPDTYTVTYNVSDDAGNAAAEVTRTVIVEDTTNPVITLLGSATVTVEAATSYTDAGATASDTLDGDLTTAIVVVNPVDVNSVGTYTVTYDVTDTNGNTATQVTRTVIVEDTTKPVITLLGSATVTVEAATSYTDAGATASDTLDGDLTTAIVAVNPVDVNSVGTYTVTYDVTDANGNAATQVTRTVIVEDTTKPVITPLGTSPITVEGGFGYTDAGATASDTLDGDLTANIVTVNGVDSGTVGSYTVTYNVTDTAGNAADEVTRSVSIVDTTPPLISLAGVNPQVIEAGEPYVELGATASDAVSGDLTAQIVVSNPVNTAVIGDYTVTYNVTDDAGLAAAPLTRTVTVVDTGNPVITNPNPPTFEPEGPYVLPPNTTELPITWPISAQDLENGLTITCTVGGVVLTPDTSSYDDVAGELTTTFSYDFPVGETTGFCTVTDAAGNSVTTPEFKVFVEDIPVASPIEPVLNVSTGSGTALTATLTNADLAANVVATDAVDDAAGVPLDIQCAPTGEFAIGETEVTCTVSDSATPSNSTTTTFTVNVQYPYDVVFESPKGNIRAGSILPIDFSYVDPATGLAIDSSGFGPSAQWIGPYTNASCSTFASGETLVNESDDAGSSKFRYAASQSTWQYSWDTPMNGGFYYRFTVSPPGVEASSICVRLR